MSYEEVREAEERQLAKDRADKDDCGRWRLAQLAAQLYKRGGVGAGKLSDDDELRLSVTAARFLMRECGLEVPDA